ncbi:MAG: efflux RND transporter periplasmic adaptor subunit [Pirellulales bacterium]|jgi:macrolide-specific efflux system membrane fusion protein|nr:efflux RND transporter periplasmic adaptor subunit [Thermoguttaceae bacterium]MDD4785696.1 efflux RND transporter periplasmic adaptor subunit [Pirellulales bacterium]MDI9442910.1 efflux RND transporter periplasmic adaptor subunit [Planctomycetota bacterium]NLZ00956.1 efflux RND transporter periplasmic adaptor subunit [Pirellulaceae bacterium]
MNWTRSACCFPLIALAAARLAEPAAASEPIRIDAVLLQLIEQVDVPARDPGVIQSLAAKEGALVAAGDPLVQLDDAEARQEVERARLESEIAEAQAKNDVDVRYAKKSLEVAEAELRRAQESVNEYPKSISQTELDHLRLTAERARLSIEQAQHELHLAALTAQLKGNALRTAEQRLARLTLRSPINGLVAQVYRRPGEWVESGQQVARILRIDRLRAEGFLSAALLAQAVQGAAVELIVDPGAGEAQSHPATLAYVSPEIDPVNGQARVWAEVENPDMRLKPGQRAAMVILPQSP